MDVSDDAAYRVEGPTDAAVSVVAFGGIKGRLEMPVFEFFSLLDRVPVRKVFVRDLEQAWYQRGVRGLGQAVDDTATSLRELIGGERAVLIGNSAGGFGALMFGALLGVERVVAFSPQTFIDRRQRLMAWDRRWRQPMAALHRGGRVPEPDLRPLLERHPVDAHVYYDPKDRLDRYHAERLRGMVNLVPHPGAGHGLIGQLRDSGALKPLLLEAIGQQQSTGVTQDVERPRHVRDPI